MDVLCPVCGEPTRSVEIGGQRVFTCPRCDGMLIADRELREIVDNHHELARDAPSRAKSVREAGRDRRLECPLCAMEMQLLPCAGSDSIVVDRCQGCGVSWIYPSEVEELAKTGGRLPEPSPTTDDKATERGRGRLYHLAVGAAIVGLIVTIYGWVSYERVLNTSGWKATPGYVVHRTLGQDRVLSGGRSRLYHSVENTYEYKVGDSKYTGHRVNPAVKYRTEMGGTPRHLFSLRDNAKEMFDRYPENRRVEVRYDPDNPSEAVLETYTPLEVTLALIAGPALLILGVVGFWRYRR